MSCLIFGRMRDGSVEVEEEALAVCSVRMVLLWAMHALQFVRMTE